MGLPDTSKVSLRDVLDQMNRSPCSRNTQSGRRENAGIKRSSVQALYGIIGQPTSPIAMMDRHPMDRRQTIVVSKVQNYNMKDERSMRSLDFMLWPEVDRYTIFPVFQFLVKL